MVFNFFKVCNYLNTEINVKNNFTHAFVLRLRIMHIIIISAHEGGNILHIGTISVRRY